MDLKLATKTSNRSHIKKRGIYERKTVTFLVIVGRRIKYAIANDSIMLLKSVQL